MLEMAERKRGKQMVVHFVIGPACSGKSYFIEQMFPKAEKIDLLDFQTTRMTVEDVVESYENMRKKLAEKLAERCIEIWERIKKAEITENEKYNLLIDFNLMTGKSRM